MRTKIEYSLELKEVPGKLKEKLSLAYEMLHTAAHCTSALSEDLEYDNVTYIKNRIDRIRRKLAAIDTDLQDCDTALTGYAETIQKLREEHQPRPNPEFQPPPEEGV